MILIFVSCLAITSIYAENVLSSRYLLINFFFILISFTDRFVRSFSFIDSHVIHFFSLRLTFHFVNAAKKVLRAFFVRYIM